LPDALCSRCYVRAETTNFDADGVMYYPKELLPGYCAIFREARGELNYCVYLLPGGNCRPADLKKLHHWVLQTNPHGRSALGPKAEMGPMRGAGLRLGGVPRSFADHLLLVGDAAGQVDPLTGEGIQYAMDGAEIAAETLREAFDADNFSARFLKRYHDRWRKAFGRDFDWSARMARVYARHPGLIDATASLVERRGASFLVDWAEIMTGGKPKTSFLRPRVVVPLLGEAVRRWWQA